MCNSSTTSELPSQFSSFPFYSPLVDDMSLLKKLLYLQAFLKGREELQCEKKKKNPYQ